MSRRIALASFGVLSLAVSSVSLGQSAGPIYTWNGTGNVRGWVKNFGTNTATLSNLIPGELTILETGTTGEDLAITDGANVVREGSSASGGLDLTGLSSLEFDIGHNGTAPVTVQFFVQASTGFTFVPLGPDIAVAPGVNTYSLPLTGLTPAQQVYIRTLGFNARDHADVGNVTWTLREVRSAGPELTQRDLITHDTGSPELGLQGAIVNFDNAAVLGNNGGQNQTGLSHNPAGSGSLQWTDVGGSNGAAMSWGNGTAWNGNTFNNRVADLSNYDTVTIRISATDPNNAGGTVNVQSFFQTNNFQFQSTNGGAALALPIDGQFHDLVFPLAGLANMNVVDLTGINLGSHAQDLVMNVDLIRFNVVPEPASMLSLAAACSLALIRRTRRVG
jgi:hypothetical protein